MKNYSIIAAICALLLGSAPLAYAGSCVDLSRAMTVGAWGVHVNNWTMDDRSCNACTSQNPNGMPGATIPGPPNKTGECCSYDCSSFVTWIVRQVPGQTGFPPPDQGPPSTWAIWANGDRSKGPQDNGSPAGWRPCDPTKQAVCVGLTEWGQGGGPGPDHATVALCGKHFNAYCHGCSPDIGDNYEGMNGKDTPGTKTGSGATMIEWVSPPGTENIGVESCSSSCTPTAGSPAPTGMGGANPAAAALAPSSPLLNGSGNDSSSNTMSQMMPMMMMMSMMGPMMSMMSGMNSGAGSSPSGGASGSSPATANSPNVSPSSPLLSGLTPSASGNTPASGGSGASSGNTIAGSSGTSSAGASTGSSGTASSGTGSSTGGSAASAGTQGASTGSAAGSSSKPASLATMISSFVNQLITSLETVLNGPLPASSTSPTAVGQAAAPSSTTAVLQQLQQLEEQQAQQAATGAAVGASQQPNGTAPAANNPSQDFHTDADGKWRRDRRLSCANFKNASTIEDCKEFYTPHAQAPEQAPAPSAPPQSPQ